MSKNQRRSFLKNITLGGLGAVTVPGSIGQGELHENAGNADRAPIDQETHSFNGTYSGKFLTRLAFPIGGIGAGMFCMEGTGAISHMSIRHRPEIFHEPGMFAAVSIKGDNPRAKVLEGPVPEWKFFGQRGTGNGAAGTTFGLPRFGEASFKTEFPFGKVELSDHQFPLSVTIIGWSPIIPGDADASSLPVGAFEYTFHNNSPDVQDAVFSFNSKNFLATDKATNSVRAATNGFILKNENAGKPQENTDFAVFTNEPDTRTDHCWFRGGWWDPLTMAWNTVKQAGIVENPPVDKDAPGASLFVRFKLLPGEKRSIRLCFAWFTPESDLQIGEKSVSEKLFYKPWYAGRFKDINELISYWQNNYHELKSGSRSFSEAFYASTLPPEVMEAVAANLTILKSPTVMRQTDGRLWSWEGCGDEGGCCHGSCTHVWNYAQAIPHLFPALERSLRETEFGENQDMTGHQGFRANLPITVVKHEFHAAADGQLGGIMKVYRDWRISGDVNWLQRIYPRVKASMDYSIKTWDPRGKGIVEEPHHNTYDIEFWGPDGMCTSFYLGALHAMVEMSVFLKKDHKQYAILLQKGKAYLEKELFNGEYYYQQIKVDGLNAPDPAKAQSFGGEYSREAVELLKKEGPKYQYGTGCLSDGILGAWMAQVCGLPEVFNRSQVTSHLLSVHQNNFKVDLSTHDNPQRPAYALGNEGGLLLCTWPKGGELSLPFVYSDEVWTGIEYQVAAHLVMMGKQDEGLSIVRECRKRYDGRVRNPFNEYECGHWYARAMSSYSLLQALTGLRYDAVAQSLYMHSQFGDFTCFLSTAGGFGTVKLKDGRPALNVVSGKIPVRKFIVDSKIIPA
ncbi:GH116 family glycosyl hydrolase [Flavihumibacter solisilvae]|uniref:Glycosyl-hydrolase family 116 catalytic region domain-containing protein n=1 Tax=Flavihumibacter solisilvae TaxID=1349421 RepID=A0A0C1L523_9BACT|nr:GH116 family glycosyl hydrolase [Flavihumibacter solisilvae]KIC95217.1 hypothetical protein OI18_07930 [Flavihumibacter solisilvae]